MTTVDLAGTVRIEPAAGPLTGTARVPRSKPHMQRAVLLSLMTNTPTFIRQPAWSSESRLLFDAARTLGMTVARDSPDEVIVTGTARSLARSTGPVWTAGSAFNFRTLAALACVADGEVVIEGDASMLERPVLRYLNFVTDLGADLEDISDSGHLRIRVRGSRRVGGVTAIDTGHSSQALTAALMVAPLADDPVRIEVDPRGPVGEGYIDLTVDLMRAQGAVVRRTATAFVVHPGVYQSRLHQIASDFTAMSYLAGVVAATGGDVVVSQYHPSSLSSEHDFVEVLDRLGIHTDHDPISRSLRIRRGRPASPVVEIDGSNIPTVVPTLAAIVPFIDARVVVHNVAHVNNHKCPRVSVMVRELNRMGCELTELHRVDGLVDGFVSPGPHRPAGGVAVSGHGDHRMFMSLATAALGARSGTLVDGAEHLRASFPDYLTTLAALGARWDHTGPTDDDAVLVDATETLRS